jgi:hypothetical protein
MINKPNDPQAQGSGISYARRYGLQSLINIGAEDDDGNKATEKPSLKYAITEMQNCKSLTECQEIWLKYPYYQKESQFQTIKEQTKAKLI